MTNDKPTFSTIKSYSIDYGTRNFIEVALKSANNESYFISISKGYTDQSGNKRYKRSLGFQVEEEVIDFLIKSLENVKSESKKLPKLEKEEKEEKE